MDSVKSRGFVATDAKSDYGTNNAGWDDDDGLEESYPPLSKSELEGLLGPDALKPSKVTVKRILLLQVVVTVLSGLAWSAKGKAFSLDSAAISAVFGGLAAFLPATLFAARAKVLKGSLNLAGASIFALVTGELLKIIATVAMFVLVVLVYPGLDWMPLLVTYVLTLKCYWLAWLLR